MARTDPQINIRVEAEFKKKLELAAIKNGRSLNAEVVRRLEQSFKIEENLPNITEQAGNLLNQAIVETLEDVLVRLTRRGVSDQVIKDALDDSLDAAQSKKR